MLKSIATLVRKFSEQLDEELDKAIKRIPQLPQRQYDTTTQLEYLRSAAVRLGLYDADDFLKKYTHKEAFLPPHGYETLMKLRRPELKNVDITEKSKKPEPIQPGEEIELFENGHWTKIKWPKNSNQVLATKGSDLKGFVTNIEKDTKDNKNFRKVLYTGKNSQLVLMSLNPREEIGEEVHEDTDQFFRVDAGSGKVVINDKETKIENGSAVVVPQGAKHNVIAGEEGLKIYTIYSPPHHTDKVIHKTKEDAEADTKDHFDGKTTEY
jgi:mannose-6-phosphate isomerase-like protein (cupin superfamily)